MSIAIIAPSIRPSSGSIFASAMPLSISLSPVLINPISGLKIKHIRIPSIRIPSNG